MNLSVSSLSSKIRPFSRLVVPLFFILLVSCSTRVLNVEKQPDGSYWISSSSGSSARSAFEAAQKQAQEIADKNKTTFKIIKKKPTSKTTVTPAHYETRWVDQLTTVTDWNGRCRTIRTTIPVSEWVPAMSYTTYYSEIWVRFNSQVTAEKP
ncbi:MAG: hypothetical protein V4507_03790 [Verrucomicrobiota bacterium]